MIPLAAYADRLSVRPGQKIRFHAANATGSPVRAALVRVVSADANPAGPGVVTEVLEAAPTTVATPRAQRVPLGSYALVENAAALIGSEGLTIAISAMPTRPEGRAQTVIALCGADNALMLRLGIDEAGHLYGEAVSGQSVRRATSARVVRGRWYQWWLSYSPRTGLLGCGMLALQHGAASGEPLLAESDPVDGLALQSVAKIVMAARGDGADRECFDGRLERPMVFDSVLPAHACVALAEQPDAVSPVPLARWDFAQDPSSSRIADVGEHARHGRLVNCPVRAVAGARWDGTEMCFRHAPSHYAAIHFHADDIDDCGWPVCYEWTVPEGTRSAVYALSLEAGHARENVPFHVVPPKGAANARLAVLASTFTYTVYANNARPEWESDDPAFRQAWHEQTRQWSAYPHNPGDHPEYGLSTYNVHGDGSGISIASWRRPMLNVRIGYITYPMERLRGSGLRHFPADTHLIAWLEHEGIAYDVITDWELHHEGVDLLGRYQAVLTGSHPEYHTRPMLDALEAYRDQGGRLCYLGGNGFYWKIALSPETDGVIEIRRGEGGIRAWAAEPGEYYNQFDGEYGGLWRRNGRPPQHLCGVGFTAQGNFSGSYYRRRAEADDPRCAWIFEGIDTDVIGNHGLSAHGAAGFELDRADKELGTPLHAIVVASSENHPPDAPWILVPEEMLTHLLTWPRQPARELIRADMTFFEAPHGGAVFSSGSITFCGSLPTNGFENDVSRLLRNVVLRFLDPTPFALPLPEDNP